MKKLKKLKKLIKLKKLKDAELQSELGPDRPTQPPASFEPQKSSAKHSERLPEALTSLI